VALAQSGDRPALDRLLKDHQAPLYRHACTIIGDPDLALDALQASMLLIARRIRAVREPRWFRAWAYRITTRECARLLRRRGRDRRMFDDEIQIETLDVAAPLGEEDLLLAWAELLTELPKGAQIIVRLHYFEDMNLAEIAEALEVPVGTVKSRLAYGLKRLRELTKVDARGQTLGRHG
jgi:RNA polymerase sigma-70 factor (ECF subfamily)